MIKCFGRKLAEICFKCIPEFKLKIEILMPTKSPLMSFQLAQE